MRVAGEDRRASSDVRDAPTVRPKQAPATPTHSAAIREIVRWFGEGEHKAALGALQALFDADLVPVLVARPEALLRAMTQSRYTELLSAIDSCSTLESVLYASKCDMIEGLEILCELLDKRIVALR